MRGPSHMILGVAGTVALQQVIPFIPPDQPLQLVLALGASVLGALLPDIDSATSTLREATGTGARPDWAARRVERLLGQRHNRSLPHFLFDGLLLVLFSLTGLIGSLLAHIVAGKHRGRTHSLAAVALLAVGAAFLQFPPWTIGFLAGYVSHLLADSLTHSGIPILWPFSQARFHLLPFGLKLTTGSWVEYLIVTPIAAWTLWAGYPLVLQALRSAFEPILRL